MSTSGKRQRTLSWPAHLLLRIHSWHGGANLEPHCTTPIPALHILTIGNFGKIILRWSGVVDLLRGYVVNGRSSWHACNIWRGFGGITANVGDRGILN
jgi:hypothetical protein